MKRKLLSANNINAGASINLTAEVQNAVNTYAIQSTLTVNKPENLKLTGITYGHFFDADSRL